MIAELSHAALAIAFALTAAQAFFSLWGAWKSDARVMAVGPATAFATLVFVGASFAGLTYLYVTSDFSVANVYANSHSAKPLLYKFTGVWSNHEGSMLLWALVLAVFSALVGLFAGNLPLRLRANVLGIQGLIAAFFLLFILTTSNPFLRLEIAPAQGQGLNPVLQDIGLALHPPLLYLGYVGCSVAFSFAVAALIEGRIDAAWARWVRPWTLVAWLFLTLGIAMGSYWAYYELGWGGYWFWDPVENASLMPWLAATALLHSALVMEKRDALKIWTVLLALLTFSLSLLGTFLVRSGVLTSVHTFASDPARGAFILCILIFFVGGSFALFALRASELKPGGIFAPVSREGALLLNNLFLSAIVATVFVGTLYPLMLEFVTGEKISVGAPFFNATVGPLALLLVAVIPAGPLLAWKRGDALAVAQKLALAALAALVCAITVFAINGAPLYPMIALSVALFAIAGAIIEYATRIALFRAPASESFTRAVGLPRASLGTLLAHIGIGLTLLGVAAEGGWSVEKIASVRPGEAIRIYDFDVRFRQWAERKGANYRDLAAVFDIRRDGITVAELAPAKRIFVMRGQQTTEAAIKTFGLSQLYLSIGDPSPDQSVALRAYWKPFVLLIWLGGVVMALGATFSLSDRRLRIGVPKRAANKKFAIAPAE
ncbi:MAG: heme lyase CcmF/NrfE family subunit [Xanthobacteraceae bacterium]|nr:heme lyase CcmF/NrfE family subunit [Xanthobacteraceae bacterium]MCW5674159.1 heme lyase CcmF/NrfE family subunit [Xanthobacteraceae bacterium]